MPVHDRTYASVIYKYLILILYFLVYTRAFIKIIVSTRICGYRFFLLNDNILNGRIASNNGRLE